MITQIRSVMVYVSDQDRAIDFYVNTLGFELRTEVNVNADAAPEVDKPVRWVEVAPRGSQAILALVAREFDALRPGKVTGQFTDIELAVDNLQATFEELSRKGVRFEVTPERTPFGYRAEMLDPDGNGFNLIEPYPNVSQG
jgi:catechol 2,3-dioxygenase-like lactoylglutathione lyase family enzyme